MPLYVHFRLTVTDLFFSFDHCGFVQCGMSNSSNGGIFFPSFCSKASYDTNELNRLARPLLREPLCVTTWKTFGARSSILVTLTAPLAWQPHLLDTQANHFSKTISHVMCSSPLQCTAGTSVEKPTETQRDSLSWLDLWSEHLASYQDDMSLNPLCGHELNVMIP